ncbi:MAG: Trm112 family protein [Gammaproteobacteria bacterium]|nr:Trm112 family protein [Gammaproteobacteria bacterium]
MAVDRRLLEILVCPVTKVPVTSLSKDKLKKLNDQISKGEVTTVDGSTLDMAVEEALITESGTTIYRVDSGIPIMLEDQGIPTEQLIDF